MSRISSLFILLESDGTTKVEKFLRIVKHKGVIMKGGFDWGNLVHWARLDLGLPLDADYCIPDEYAREMLAKIAAERGEGSSFYGKVFSDFGGGLWAANAGHFGGKVGSMSGVAGQRE